MLVSNVKVLHSICRQIWKTQQWPQDRKRSVFIPIPKKSNAKEYSNYHTTVLISYARKVVLKILQARLQQFMNWELPDIQARFRKGRETRANCQHLLDHRKSKRVKNKIYFCFFDYAKAFVGKQQTVENSSRDNTRPPHLPSAKSVCRSRSNS